MPNHVTTIIRGSKAALDFLKTDESEADFNTVIPFPEELQSLTAEYRVFDTEAEAEAYNVEKTEAWKNLPEVFRGPEGAVHGISAARKVELTDKYGPHLDWYNWKTAHWGTKWGAYDVDRKDDTILQFDTAWSHPRIVVAKLSEKFPDEVFIVQYADEDLGANLGEYTLENGITISETEFGGYGDPSTMEFATQVKYGQTYAEYRAEWEDDDEE